MSRNKKKFFLLLLTIVAGVTIFYFILNLANTLEEKAFRVGSDGNSQIYINLGYDLDDDKYLKVKNHLIKSNEDITNIYHAKRVGINSIGQKTFSNLVIYENDDVLKSAIKEFQYDSTQKIKAINASNELDYDFEAVFSMYAANKHLNPVGQPVNSNLENFVGKIITKIDSNTKEELRIKVSSIFFTDIASKTNDIYTTKVALEQMDLNSQSVLQINVNNPLDSSKVLSKIKPYLVSELNLNEYQIIDWQVGNEFIINLIYVERISIFLIQMLTAIAISFGISNVLVFDIKEKTNQIGILKALGFSNKNAIALFHLQSSIVSVIGIALGILLGQTISVIFSNMFKNSLGVPLLYLNHSYLNFWSILTIIVMFVFNQLGMIIPDRSVKKLAIIDIIKEN